MQEMFARGGGRVRLGYASNLTLRVHLELGCRRVAFSDGMPHADNLGETLMSEEASVIAQLVRRHKESLCLIAFNSKTGAGKAIQERKRHGLRAR